MKKLILTLLFILITTHAFADKLEIYFDCYPKEVQEMFHKRGYKLDLSGNDRTRKSWGFIVSEGSRYFIYTYKALTMDELDMVKEVVMEAECQRLQ